MDFYINILIKPDAEMRENLLLNKVYTKLHKALVTLRSTDIGVSFPQYKLKLGRVIRIHGSKQRLSQLQDMDWLGSLSGYCTISAIEPIPKQTAHRTISRKQANMTQAKLRRLVKRGSISPEEAKNYKAKMFGAGFDNAYLELESTSSGQRYRRYIVFGVPQPLAVSGAFDQFGLSQKATVPWF